VSGSPQASIAPHRSLQTIESDYTNADPADELSVLSMWTPQSGTKGTVVGWRSVSGQSYRLERATDLNASFSLLQGNIIGHAGTTTHTDTNAVGSRPIFYRVGVHE